jgi:hypothetical protein
MHKSLTGFLPGFCGLPDLKTRVSALTGQGEGTQVDL